MLTTINPENSVLFNLAYLSKIMNRRANALFKSEGARLRIEQLPVLMTLYFNGAMTQQELADAVDRDKSSIQRTLTTLLKNSVVTVRTDENDKRKNNVLITEYGRSLALLMDKELANVEHQLFDHFSLADRQQLLEILGKLR